MKNITLLLYLLMIGQLAIAQKTLITNESHKNWEYLGGYDISSDGKYLWYKQNGLNPKTVLMSNNMKFAKVFHKGGDGRFSKDGKFFFVRTDSGLVTIQLKPYNLKMIKASANVINFTIADSDIGKWIIFSEGKKVNIYDIYKSKLTESYWGDDYSLSPDGAKIAIKNADTLLFIDLATGVKSTMLVGASKCRNIAFDTESRQLCFTAEIDDQVNVYHFEVGKKGARILISANSAGLSRGFQIANSVPTFSKDGKLVYFKLKQENSRCQSDNNLITDKVDVWNYKDLFIMSNQLDSKEENKNREYLSVVSLKTGKILQLENDSMEVAQFSHQNSFLLLKSRTYEPESYFNPRQVPSYKLFNINSWIFEDFITKDVNVMRVSMSPSEKFVYWYDKSIDDYFTYEIEEGTKHNVTEDIKVASEISYQSDGGLHFRFSPDPIVWSAEDEAMLIEDNFDIWQIDPLRNKFPINLTGGYGRLNNIKFQAGEENLYLNLKLHKKIILRAMNMNTMANGFWIAELNSSSKLSKKSMDDCLYSGPAPLPVPFLKRAEKANVFIVSKQTASESPNIYISKNLKDFNRVSAIYPEKKYNWLKSQLISYSMTNGKKSKAILYMPDNFDVKKKYPVIFSYYQIRSTGLHQYLSPWLSYGDLNIPWYVSNGYLVCVVDIVNDEPGKIADNAINSVESAVKYLSKNSWFDFHKLGLQGHSFGGFETNYIIGGSKLFAAAQSSAGISNAISNIGDVRFGENSLYSYWQMGQGNFGADVLPWSHPDIYVNHTVIFRADQITTPLLLQTSKTDGGQYNDAVQLFSAMRRLNKPVWLLQYDNGGHILYTDDMQLDFTVRQQQFFNYYLKNEPAPIWMLDGVSARDKGIKSGLDLDNTGRKIN